MIPYLLTFNWHDLINPEFYIVHGGLWLLLFVIFAETGLFAGFFLPGDSLLFVAGIYAHNMKNDDPGLSHSFLDLIGLGSMNNEALDLLVLILLVSVAGIFGNMVGYWFGKKSGPFLYHRKDTFFFKKKYLHQAHDFYQKYGGWAIVAARFVPIIRTFAPIVAGVVQMEKKKFTYFNIVGCVAWVTSMILAGHFLQKWILSEFGFDLKDHLEIIVIGIVLVSTVPIVWKLFFQQKQNRKRSIIFITMQEKKYGILSLPVLVAALGYFVDIYDLLLFSIIRIPSLKSLGLNDEGIAKDGLFILNIQMIGLLVGGILWGVLGDKKGRLKVLYASIILYSLGNIANGFVQNVDQYAIIRFITGIGLAGELGAGITLVTELLPKEKRGLGTSMVAGIGLLGAVFAFFLKEMFIQPDNTGWRICYFIGGGLGALLLILRIGVLESSMFKNIQHAKISKGNFLMLFTNGKRFKKYLLAILIGLPNWYVIGILITFSKEFGAKMGIQGAIDPGKSVMYAYAAISIGDIFIGFVSNWLKSRKKALYIFYVLTAIGIIWFFNLHGASVAELYMACALLGFGTGMWAIFVTMAAEQFGTNIRATVATTVPNMVRGSLTIISILFAWLQVQTGDYLKAGWITGVITLSIAILAAVFSEETFHKDLNYLEGAV